MDIIIGSTSKLKVSAVEAVVEEYMKKDNSQFQYTLRPYDVESGVPHTPYNEQTFQGANNRAKAVMELHANGDYFVGLESGLVEREGRIFEECWCVMYDKDKKQYIGYSSGFMLPQVMADRMKEGESHIRVLEEFGRELQIDTKDTWSLYSHGKLKRIECLKEAIRNAVLAINV